MTNHPALKTLTYAFFAAFACLLPAAGMAQSVLKPGFEASSETIVDSRWKSGVPLGGLGVGKIELLTDGSFGNFTTQGNLDRPYGWAKGAFAAVRVQTGTGAPIAKVLRLTTPDEYAGVVSVQHTRTVGLFPRVHLDYADSDLPVTVALDAFSPLIPHDVKDSALPVACLSYTLTNPTKQTVTASILLAWSNLLGWGVRSNSGGDETWNSLSGDTQAPASAGALRGLRYTTTQSYSGQHQNAVGEDFVGVRQEPGVQISTCPSWDAAASTPAFWNNFTSSGQLQPMTGPAPAQPARAVSGLVTLAPSVSRTVRFYVVWAMPHLVTFRPSTTYGPDTTSSKVGTDALFDGDATTRWTTNRPMQPGDALPLDMGKAQPVARIVLESAVSPDNYPRGCTVEGSDDGQAWHSLAQLSAADVSAAVRNGTRGITFAPQSARFLRITNLGTAPGLYWSVHELTVFGP